MKIGIIGASLAGLIAGDKLAKAGHDVTVIEKNRALGGRLATKYIESGFFDYGVPYINAEGRSFKQFIGELVQQNVLSEWTDHLQLHDGQTLYETNPNYPDRICYAGSKGINKVANHLKRWVDVKSEVKAGGLTYIGADRGKKRAWMINLTDISVFECDAVIIATPGPEAYGMLLTAQDETPVRRIIRLIDNMQYEPRFALMASYQRPSPEWKGIVCEGSHLRWMGNESSKGESNDTANILIQSTGAFAREHRHKGDEDIMQLLLKRAADVADPWLSQPDDTRLHLWKYFASENPIQEYFLEIEMEDAPLALVGDYMNGNTVENAYESGEYLANYWIDKYEARTVTA